DRGGNRRASLRPGGTLGDGGPGARMGGDDARVGGDSGAVRRALRRAARGAAVRRRGLVVALIGPDGSGKTTVAEGLVARLGGSEFPRAHYFRRWLGILPRHRDVKARIGRPPADARATAAKPLG